MNAIMKAKELDEILRRHKLWIYEEDGGKRATFHDVALEGMDLRGVDLTGAIMRNVTVTRCDLEDALLGGAHLEGVTFAECCMSSTEFAKTHLHGVSIADSFLYKSDFHNALLSRVAIEDCDLHRVDFTSAQLRNVSFRGTKIGAVDFRGSELVGLSWDSATTIDLPRFSLDARADLSAWYETADGRQVEAQLVLDPSDSRGLWFSRVLVDGNEVSCGWSSEYAPARSLLEGAITTLRGMGILISSDGKGD